MNPRLTTVEAMKLAITEAYKGQYFVSPNPLVGCVVLHREGYVLKVGHHQKYGGPHAEVNALTGLEHDQIVGAHVIVTLEPCAHHGKTPPCAEMLARLPIAKLTFGVLDPNPLVSGKGAEIVRKAGIEVSHFSQDFPQEAGVIAELEEVCEAFLWNFRKKKVWVCQKSAVTLDGMMATKSGESKWITGMPAREYGHHLRASFDAIVVGAGTVVIDNPSLNIRLPHVEKKNRVVILDRQGHLNISGTHLAQSHQPEKILVLSPQTQASQVGEHRETVKEWTAEAVLEVLYGHSIRSVLLEGGARTQAWFWQTGWVNRLHLMMAPKILGLQNGQHWTNSLGRPDLKSATQLTQTKVQKLGDDIHLTGLVRSL
ncbi:MAG TPA: bifunctional diaminohydroxyphosphoribosylaminopyrimidine deaminase/5-amino-6-(5-phosphoribosylamino)uracil reductase RibD [Pseudobdellovibrionaceae bacterium]|nr:bifunctional diaminohydroxyphosphoribosylaminopyrimidine deaminase/5-amino-6-(5-phosphoribosylamino)uracil reductase RibD [Pseudobdellovibrionaceae bacterium]